MSYLSDLDLSKLPRHVAVVMDGNGRWAKQRGLPRTQGHEAGEEALYDVVLGALDIGLEWLTVYAFSTENWKRPPSEVRFLINFNRILLRKRRDELNRLGARILFTGRRADWRVPRSVLKDMEDAEELTRSNRKTTLNIAFNYGGRTEVVDAIKRLVRDHDAGQLKGRVTPESISARLYHPEMPDPDLLIRTGGEMRISNFLIWQAAYSELWFTPVYWPDFSREHLYEAIRDYQKRDRRFGGIEDQ
jgi:undecaprenyl diphosphate synthase